MSALLFLLLKHLFSPFIDTSNYESTFIFYETAIDFLLKQYSIDVIVAEDNEKAKEF